jgi:regulator of nucleoside diphosphate kinase
MHRHRNAEAWEPSIHPPVMVRERDRGRLHEIAIGSMLSSPRLAGALLDELQRAEVRPDDEVPADVVGIGSVVVCAEDDGDRQRIRWAQIVSPEAADPERGLVSVLSDLGAAVIGLSTGRSIDWPDRRGRARRFTVLAVESLDLDCNLEHRKG